MECTLCLEKSMGSKENIERSSFEEQRLELQCLIQQHFPWFKINIYSNEGIPICRSCSNALNSFHKFCLRIETAHKLLECDIKPVGEFLVVEPQMQGALLETELDDNIDTLGTIDIKLEPEVDEDEIVKQKRKRGRPRKTELHRNNNIKEPEMRSSDNLTNKRNANITDLNTTIKTKTLEEVEKIDLPKVLIIEASGSSEQNSRSSSEGNASLLCPNKKESMSKALYNSHNVELKRERDAYISHHFKLTCCLCNVTLEDFTVLQTHFRTEHQRRGYAKCCGKKLYKRCLLFDHLRAHEDPEYFKCPHCNRVMANRNCFNKHLKHHEESPERNHECEICFKRYATQARYERHKLIHLPEEKKTIPCPKCGKTFAARYKMNYHLRYVHENAYARVCDICGKPVVGQLAMHRHLEEHAGVPRPTLQCNMCKAIFTSKSGLNLHMKANHSEKGSQSFSCPICSKVSPTEHAHKEHIKYMHKMERKHICNLCGKAFKRPKNLREHMTTHTGQVLYTCPHCPKTFNSNANMYSHIKKTHPKEFEEKRKTRNRN